MKLLTPKEYHEKTGMPIATVYRKIASRKIKSVVKFGRKLIQSK